MSKTYLGAIAGHLGGLSDAGAPDAVRERVRTALLYNLTMGLAGRRANSRMDGLIQDLHAAPGAATILGSRARRAPSDAVFINAGLITARGQNDTYPALVAHVGSVVVPAALAAAETAACSGAEFLTALLRGYETVAKIARDAADEVNARGFRATPVFSLFGAAAASASILRLTQEQTAHALAIAANFAGGVKQCWADGSEEWRLQVANASRAGYMSALYAQSGITGAAHALEGGNGFFRAFSGSVPQLVLDGWSILDLVFKPYPGCAFNQAPVHVLRALLADADLDGAQVRCVTVTMNPADAAYPGINAYGPFDTESGAIMSAPFMLAATLRDGAPGMRHFSEGRTEAGLDALSRIVRLEADAAIPRWRCRVAVEMADGRRFESATGDEELFAFSWDETRDVLASVAADWDGPDALARFKTLAAAIRGLDRAEDIGALMAAIRPKAADATA